MCAVHRYNHGAATDSRSHGARLLGSGRSDRYGLATTSRIGCDYKTDSDAACTAAGGRHVTPCPARPPERAGQLPGCGVARGCVACCSLIQEKIAREGASTVPSLSFITGSFLLPVAASNSSREPLRRNGIGLPCAAITLSYSMPALRRASWTRRHGC